MTQPTPVRREAGSRPRLLDAFCCQGGAAKGYADAGFDMTGIDLNPQPDHPAHTVPQAKMGRPIPDGWYGHHALTHLNTPAEVAA